MKDDIPDIDETLKMALQKFYGRERAEIHVSDLIYCMRKQCFRKLDPNPSPLTDADLNNFATGRGIHGALEALTAEYPDRFEREMEVKLHFDDTYVVAHIDIYDKAKDMPVEAKTYRVSTPKIPNHKPPRHQLQQLRFYMCMTGKNNGVLLGEYINQFDKFPFIKPNIYLTDKQLENERAELIRLARLFKRGLDTKDPSILPHIFYEPEGKWQCPKCPYNEPCFQMRVKEIAEKLK